MVSIEVIVVWNNCVKRYCWGLEYWCQAVLLWYGIAVSSEVIVVWNNGVNGGYCGIE
jgi:hypothetical protein